MKPKFLPIGIALSLAGTMLGLSYAVSGYGSTGTTGPEGTAANSKYLEITNHTYSVGDLFTLVNGTVSNNSSSVINSATVHVEYYNSNDSLITISSSTADFPILNPGDSSTFQIRSELGDEIVDHYVVKPGGDIAP
jgi:hypothetical protein